MLALPDSRQRKEFETEFIKPMTDHLKTIPGFIDVKVDFVTVNMIKVWVAEPKIGRVVG